MSGQLDQIPQSKENPHTQTADGLSNDRAPLDDEKIGKRSAISADKSPPSLDVQPVNMASVFNEVKKHVSPGLAAGAELGLATSMTSLQKRLIGKPPSYTDIVFAGGKAEVRLHEIDSRVLMGTAALTAGMSSYALKSDLESLANSRSFKQELLYGVASGFDAMTLVGSSLSLIPGTRKLAAPLMIAGSFGRVVTRVFE